MILEVPFKGYISQVTGGFHSSLVMIGAKLAFVE